MKNILKILIVFVLSITLILCSCVGVLGATTYKTLTLNLAKSKVVHSYEDVQQSAYYNLDPSVYDSPFGGKAYMYRFTDSQLNSISSNPNSVASNTYFNELTFIKNRHYVIDLYLVVRESNLFYEGEFEFELTYFNFVDNDRVIRLSTPSEYLILDSNNDGIYYVETDSVKLSDFEFSQIGTASYGFLPIHWEFIPSKTFTGWFFNYQFIFNHLDNTPLSFWGISDVVIKESVNDVSNADVANYINDLNEDVNKLDDDFNEAFNVEKYDPSDRGQLDSETELSQGIYDATSGYRDQAGDMFKDFPKVEEPSTLEDVPDAGSDLSFIETIYIWKNIFDYALYYFPWWNTFLHIALALGIFSFLFGFFMLVQSHIRGKEREAERQRQRERYRRKGGN